jgi:YARHG domain
MPIFRMLKAYLLVITLFASWNATLVPAAAQGYRSLSCGELWERRNAIFARNGYCFKTERAIRVFGNSNCRFEVEGDVPMSRGERRDVDEIRAAEREKGCSN